MVEAEIEHSTVVIGAGIIGAPAAGASAGNAGAFAFTDIYRPHPR